jgi:hypothetical protein
MRYSQNMSVGFFTPWLSGEFSHRLALERTAVGAFRFATSCRFAPPQFGGSSAFGR